jgi:hypothetical protein
MKDKQLTFKDLPVGANYTSKVSPHLCVKISDGDGSNHVWVRRDGVPRTGRDNEDAPVETFTLGAIPATPWEKRSLGDMIISVLNYD